MEKSTADAASPVTAAAGETSLIAFIFSYGIVFSAWGVGGFLMGRLSQMLQAGTGSFDLSFIAAPRQIRRDPATLGRPEHFIGV